MAKILLIDDDEDVRYALGKYLRRAGHTVTEAQDGKQALAMVALEPFDVVVTDIIMPEADGIEVVLELRQSHPHQAIIAISGGGRIGKAEYLGTVAALGANAALPKPVDPDELLRVIDRLMVGG